MRMDYTHERFNEEQKDILLKTFEQIGWHKNDDVLYK